ncbi:MAG: TetR/AcrR family transcriptional regulator [Propionibacteriaceae bacterium]|nr:TetR/AcrR family transcriptional regulator [Propionibacteriaceae bacterium]
MARPRVHDEALAEALLDEATRIVGTEGPAALSLRRLTQAAGTSTSAIYSLYGSRDALLDAVYARAINSFALATTVEPTASPLADLLEMGILYRRWALENPQMYPMMFGKRPNDTPEAIRERTRSTVEPLLECVTRCIKGGLLKDAPPAIIVSQLWASVHGYVSLELDGILCHALPLSGAFPSEQDHYETLLRASVAMWRA